MPRLLFEKTGNAIWVSHLDLMLVFQRAFKRAGIPLKHTQGFNPRPSVSIALPLSVGVESCCELLDFDLDDCDIPMDEIQQRLNQVLVEGVNVLSVYGSGRKIRELSLLQCCVALEYDKGIPQNATDAIRDLFKREEVLVCKKTKSGQQEQNIIPMIHHLDIIEADSNTLHLQAMIACQNPTLNPIQLAQAVCLYLPQYKPNFHKCGRIEIYDLKEKVFR